MPKSWSDPSHPENRPPRGYRWPPFTEANTAALRHGAHSPAIRDPIADELRERALAVAPHLSAPEFEAELMAWSRAEAMVLLMARNIDEHGPFDRETGNPRPVVDALAKWEGSAAKRREALGLSPLAKARLGRDLAGMAPVELLSRYLREQYGVTPDESGGMSDIPPNGEAA